MLHVDMNIKCKDNKLTMLEERVFDQLKILDCNNFLDSSCILRSLFEDTGYGSGTINYVFDECTGKIVRSITLHTGGWSDCEVMIDYLERENKIFWALYWFSTKRGGHYEFRDRGFL